LFVEYIAILLTTEFIEHTQVIVTSIKLAFVISNIPVGMALNSHVGVMSVSTDEC